MVAVAEVLADTDCAGLVVAAGVVAGHHAHAHAAVHLCLVVGGVVAALQAGAAFVGVAGAAAGVAVVHAGRTAGGPGRAAGVGGQVGRRHVALRRQLEVERLAGILA